MSKIMKSGKAYGVTNTMIASDVLTIQMKNGFKAQNTQDALEEIYDIGKQCLTMLTPSEYTCDNLDGLKSFLLNISITNFKLICIKNIENAFSKAGLTGTFSGVIWSDGNVKRTLILRNLEDGALYVGGFDQSDTNSFTLRQIENISSTNVFN